MIYVFAASVIVGFSIVIFKYFKEKDRKGALKHLDFAINFIVRLFYLSFGSLIIFMLISLFSILKIINVNVTGNTYIGLLCTALCLISVFSLCAACGGALAYVYSYINFCKRNLLEEGNIMKKHRYADECCDVFDIIRPYECHVKNEDIIEEKNEQAKKALIDFYYEFKNKENKRFFVMEYEEEKEGIFNSINPLLKVYLALKYNNYCLAIWELMGIYPLFAFYDRYYYNILNVLARGLGLNDK